MKSNTRSFIPQMLLIFLVLFARGGLLPQHATAQQSKDAKIGLRDALWLCLRDKVPGVQRSFDGGTAFDPASGRNFAYDDDKHAWVDTKTLECICPKCIPGASDAKNGRRDALWLCLRDKVPGVQRSFDGGTAFDPATGRNFAYDDDRHAWMDTKTLECICPKCEGGQPAEKKVIEKKKEACDIEFGYDYMRTPDESAKNLNGFGGSLFCNVKPWIAIGGDFGALFGSTTDTVGTTKIDVSLHRQTYLFGPQFNFYPNDKVKLFVHPLFGGMRDTTTTIFGTTTTDAAASAFAMAFGGGVDVNLNKRFAVRAIQVDYLPTHFGGDWQNNYKISTGLVIHLGERK